MIKRIVAALFVLAVFVCVCGKDAVAQSSQACGIGWFCTDYGGGPAGPCAPTPPPTAIFIGAETPGTFLFSVPTAACYRGNPDACPKCTAQAGHPISLATGNTFIEQTDVTLAGLAGGLTLIRTWNSRLPSMGSSSLGMFGPNWRSTYEERVFIGSDGYFKYSRGDGATWSFGFAESPSDSTFKYLAVSPTNGGGGASLVISPSSWPLTFGNGEQRFFDTN